MRVAGILTNWAGVVFRQFIRPPGARFGRRVGTPLKHRPDGGRGGDRVGESKRVKPESDVGPVVAQRLFCPAQDVEFRSFYVNFDQAGYVVRGKNRILQEF